MYYIKNTSEFGRGVYAESTIFKDQVITKCELLVLSQADTLTLQSTDLSNYTFKFNETNDCIVLGDGEIFNHSDEPNVSYSLETIDGRKFMVFKALKKIQRDQQLFIDYAADVKVDVNKYVNSKSLLG